MAHRLPTEIETLEAWELMERAIEERRVISVSYFRVLKDSAGRERRFGDDRPDGELPQVLRAFGPRPMLQGAPVHRVGEPVLLAWSKEGNPYAHVIVYRSSDGLAVRTVRLDRVSVGAHGMRLTLTRRPFIVAGTGLDPSIDRRVPAQ